ncbi:phosphodiesterase [Gallibacterium anatis]|uniref:CCA-adding enzyme n=1 Tax=Gallibacterium anatis TaxID=750 RepID=A0A0A2XLE0_9PAST|nr:phosphodiesterase [Gallibacterium anatis]KGQ33136.1 phosphodiesterase [Gallibacterium anatis]
MTQAIKTYLVGGAVRDRLLGLAVKDRDWLVVHATPEWLLKQGYIQVGKDFPVFLHPQTKEEYALARTERKNGRGYTGFYCDFSPDITLEQDLKRRDLTINAIAQDIDGNLYDPYHGIQDLKQRKLRHISPAFSEDPLRILRVARFAARFYAFNFTIAPETVALMKSMVKQGELADLTVERIWLETEKALLSPRCDIYFSILHQIGATSLFPEFKPLFQSRCKLLTQSLKRLNLLLEDQNDNQAPLFRFVLLCALLVSSETLSATQRKQLIEKVQQLCQRYKIPNHYSELAKLAMQFILPFSQTEHLSANDVIDLLDQLDCWRKPQRLEQLNILYCAIFTDFGLAQQKQWQHWYQQAKSVDIQQIIADGFQKQAIKKELYRRRVATISQYFNG